MPLRVEHLELEETDRAPGLAAPPDAEEPSHRRANVLGTCRPLFSAGMPLSSVLEPNAITFDRRPKRFL